MVTVPPGFLSSPPEINMWGVSYMEADEASAQVLINQSINQSVLFQAARPIETTTKHTRKTGTDRRTIKTDRDREHLQMIVKNMLKPQISTKHA